MIHNFFLDFSQGVLCLFILIVVCAVSVPFAKSLSYLSLKISGWNCVVRAASDLDGTDDDTKNYAVALSIPFHQLTNTARENRLNLPLASRVEESVTRTKAQALNPPRIDYMSSEFRCVLLPAVFCV